MKTLLRFAAVMSFALAGVFGWATHGLAQDEVEPETVYANVMACTDAECSNMTFENMGDAVITTVDAEGGIIDTCTVIAWESGMSGCDLVPHDGTGSYVVEPSSAYADYALVSAEPEILESVSHGTQYIWYFAPAAEDVPQPGDGEEDPIAQLPETGVGATAQSGVLSMAAIGIALVAIGATGIRRHHNA